MKPIILIAATSHWFPAARLAMALAEAGCVVEGVCSARHPLRKVSSVSRVHRYSGLMPLISLERAIRNAKAQLIIPADDLAARQLHHLHRQQLRKGGDRSSVCVAIERSLGSRESFPVVYERATLMKLAQELGVRAPQTRVVRNFDELQEWILEVGFPFVLKADGTSGGDGVRIVRTLEEADRAFRKLKAPVQLARAVKRALVNYDKTLVWPSLLRRSNFVSAQTFVAGREATSSVACWNGHVLAALHFEVLNKKHNAGHATVLRLIDHPEMSASVERLVHQLKLSGVHGFDFMVEAGTGNAYLIEINPRTTQVGHLTLGLGRDIPAALVAAVSGSIVTAAPKLTENQVITLFPQEWERDASSSYIRSGYHDVPWAEPALLQACVRQAQKHRSLNARKDHENQRSSSLLPINSTMAPESSMVRCGDTRHE